MSTIKPVDDLVVATASFYLGFAEQGFEVSRDHRSTASPFNNAKGNDMHMLENVRKG